MEEDDVKVTVTKEQFSPGCDPEPDMVAHL